MGLDHRQLLFIAEKKTRNVKTTVCDKELLCLIMLKKGKHLLSGKLSNKERIISGNKISGI